MIFLSALLSAVDLLITRTDCKAQRETRCAFPVGTFAGLPALRATITDTCLSVQPPETLYADTPLSPGAAGRLIKDYDPVSSDFRLFTFYTLHFSCAKHPLSFKILVPYYTFQGTGVCYILDSIITSGDTFLLRFAVPAPQGHRYDVSLNWRSRRVNYVRYIGQGGAGGFTLCLNHVGEPIGRIISIDHFQPGSNCYDVTSGYNDTGFLGRGIHPMNNRELIELDEHLNITNTYGLRYKILSIQESADFLLILDKAGAAESAAEIPVKQAIKDRRIRR